MQLQLIFKVINPLSLPLSHHHIIQGLIYNLLKSNSRYSHFLHNIGYSDGTHKFKLFTFSQLEGHYSIKGKNIIFDDIFTLEIRSPMDDFINTLVNSLSTATKYNSLFINNQAVSLLDFKCINIYQSKKEVFIKMKTPLCVNDTIVVDEKQITKYYTPLDDNFAEMIRQNSQNKYLACFDHTYNDFFLISTTCVGTKDKYVTKFKNQIYITGWRGEYKLSASSKMLNFLYNTGIGTKNSQGFGMFEYIE